MDAPRDNLLRAWTGTEAVGLRSTDGGDGNTLYGHFAVFDEWTEINSLYEGHFLERIAPPAFDRTIAERGNQIRVLYDHGADVTCGNKPLGVPNVLEARGTGAYYEVGLFDASYVNDLKPAIRAGQLGSSFRFRVVNDDWVTPQRASDHNPSQLDERTINEVELYEFGPVTFPAYDNATAGLRSGTDDFVARLLHEPRFLARFTERAGLKVVEGILADTPARGDVTFSEITEAVEDAVETLIGADDITSDVWICDITDTWAVFQVWGALEESYPEYWKVTYTFDQNGDATITGDPVQVEQTYVPANEPSDGRSRKRDALKAAARGPVTDFEQRRRAIEARLRVAHFSPA